MNVVYKSDFFIIELEEEKKKKKRRKIRRHFVFTNRKMTETVQEEEVEENGIQK